MEKISEESVFKKVPRGEYSVEESESERNRANKSDNVKNNKEEKKPRKNKKRSKEYEVVEKYSIENNRRFKQEELMSEIEQIKNEMNESKDKDRLALLADVLSEKNKYLLKLQKNVELQKIIRLAKKQQQN